MPKTNKSTVKESETPWGTWDELLLACAVNRYGAQSWESVAVEIQKRCSGPAIRHLLTPENCEQKYLDLKRRYKTEKNEADRTYAGDDDDRPEIETIPWLDELRKLRMAELKRELERYDLSIVSLQKKVNRLKEERESSENGEEKSDLEKSETEAEREEKDELKRESDKLLPELNSGKSERDNQTLNESNWTDPKGENVETVTVKVESEAEQVRTGELKIEPDVPELVKPVLEESCNDSSDSIVKEPVLVSVKVERAGASESPEMESMAESDGGAGEDGAKENSDVQSSASKLRKEGHDPVVRGSSIGDEPENEDNHSPAREVVYAKSQPLIDILEILQSHKLGSVFGSRLASQESVKYKNLIREHVDLKTLQTRLDEGFYSDCTLRFYRDLLLLVNNALIFFRKKSSEFLAATELRQLVSKKIAQHEEKVPPVQLPKKGSDPCDSLLLKPKIAGPAIVCRKRSSIASKALGFSEEKEKREALSEEKPINKSDVNQVEKKGTKDSSSSGSRNGKKTVKNECLDLKTEKKMNPNTGDVKKQSVANFLNRMKRSSSSNNNGSTIDNLSDGKGAQRSGRSNGEGKKEQISKRSFGGRQQKEEESPKRAAGRPPKRAATRPPPPQSSVSGKRSREAGDTQVAKQPKKRSRK